MSMLVKVKRMSQTAVIPTYAHDGDSGFDLFAAESVVITPGDTDTVSVGLSFEIPIGYELQIRPRSGISSKTPLRVILGTVDSTYRGIVKVIVHNTYDRLDSCVYDDFVWGVDGNAKRVIDHRSYPRGTYIIRTGDKIAQGVIVPVIHAGFDVVDELADSERGNGGFGSSGV